jgi:glycosyltransferase involved in cell wall biosynthesis
MDNHFIIIVPVYNAVNYIEDCLESILNQSYQNYELVVMDDCSTDGTWQKVGDICNRYNGSFSMCRNEYRTDCALANFVKAIELFSFDREDILCLVDGDDRLSDGEVLTYLNEVYQDPDIWLTYGQYVPFSGTYPPYCKPVLDTRTYRRSRDWRTSHLRTIKRKLWDRIDDNDLRGKGGKYYKRVADAAYLYPAIEMCGEKHFKFIERVLYIYNDMNPANERLVNKDEQVRLGMEIQDKPLYEELTEL